MDRFRVSFMNKRDRQDAFRLLIEIQMDVRGVLRFFALALLCFNMAAAGSEGNRKADELVLEYRFYSALGQINEDLVQFIFTSKSSETIHGCDLIQFLCVFVYA